VQSIGTSQDAVLVLLVLVDVLEVAEHRRLKHVVVSTTLEEQVHNAVGPAAEDGDDLEAVRRMILNPHMNGQFATSL